jgi:hypothetical protein
MSYQPRQTDHRNDRPDAFQQEESPLPTEQCLGGQRARADSIQHQLGQRSGIEDAELRQYEPGEHQQRTHDLDKHDNAPASVVLAVRVRRTSRPGRPAKSGHRTDYAKRSAYILANCPVRSAGHGHRTSPNSAAKSNSR